ncbi:MAG: hypothetical protein QM741_13390 [Rudaea sp.]|uniref:hypothetical protein n=1 Tax=Rudaea sp. TaxID=2136325 RepID=UPI0039E4FD17
MAAFGRPFFGRIALVDNFAQVIPQGFGADDVAVDIALGFACYGFGVGCEGFGLRRRFLVANFRWDNLSHLIRIQRRPYLLPALHHLGTQRAGRGRRRAARADASFRG